MQQLVYVSPGLVTWQASPDPVIEAPDDAIVQPLAVSRCELDLPMAKLGLFHC